MANTLKGSYGCKIVAGPSLMKMMMCVNKEGNLTTSELLVFTIQAPNNGVTKTIQAWVKGYERIDDSGKQFFIKAYGTWKDSEQENQCEFFAIYNTEIRKSIEAQKPNSFCTNEVILNTRVPSEQNIPKGEGVLFWSHSVWW